MDRGLPAAVLTSTVTGRPTLQIKHHFFAFLLALKDARNGVSNWILTSCQLHRVMSGYQTVSPANACFRTLLTPVSLKPFSSPIYKINPYIKYNTKHMYTQASNTKKLGHADMVNHSSRGMEHGSDQVSLTVQVSLAVQVSLTV